VAALGDVISKRIGQFGEFSMDILKMVHRAIVVAAMHPERDGAILRDVCGLVATFQHVFGDALVTPINIIGLDYNVTISDAHMMIGCEHHLISEWKSFDDRRIIQMDGARAAKFWKTHGPYLLALCADRPGIGDAK